MKQAKYFLAASLALALSGQALAFPEADFQQAVQQFRAPSGAGGEEASAATFAALLKAEPGHPLLMAYSGAATTKLATTTMFPWKKMAYAEEGLNLLDKSLQLLGGANEGMQHEGVPVALEVRFVAANTFLAVPDFMKRGARGQKLLQEVLDHAQFGQAPLGFRGAVWMLAASTAMQQKRNDDARRYLDAVIQNHAPQAEAAKRMLAGAA